MIPSQRHLFSIPDDVAYFNCAYYAPLLRASEAALIEGARTKSRPWDVTAPDFFRDAETLRSLATELYGGSADGWAIVPAVSYGVSTAARALEPELRAGDAILVAAEEFPSNVLPWRSTARAKGCEIVTVPAPGEADWARALLEALDAPSAARVRVAALSTCHWTNGTFIDAARVAARCREKGIAVVLDATQTLGVLPFSVDDVRPDFLVAACYKWQLGPYGLGLMHVSERWRGARPLEESWLGRSNAEDFTQLANYSDDYMPGARRFDVGEKALPSILPGGIAALEQVRAWGIANIAKSLAAVNASIARRLLELGYELAPESVRCPHMFGARAPGGSAAGLVAELRRRKIFVSQRGDSVRFAPHLYVSEADVSRLLEAVGELKP